METIELSKYGKKHPKKYVVLVDDQDYEFLNKFNWFVSVNNRRSTCYAATKIVSKMRYMHRILLNDPDSLVDHIDRNGLNNQRNNLRLASPSLNGQNCKISSNNNTGFIGVYWNKKYSKFYARIVFNYRKIFIGSFDDPKQAAKAYNKKAVEIYGINARVNNV